MTFSPHNLLKELIKIPSFSREEKAATYFLQAEMEKMGLEVARFGNNLWTKSPFWDDSKPTILLNAHIDTVKPTHSWSENPFVPIEKEGKIFGLGSNDDGGSLVALFATFLQLKSTQQPYNLTFAISAEEEIGGANGMKILQKQLPKIDLAIVGEPTNMAMAIAEKGLLVLDCESTGKAGHAARNEGENAIYKALQDIEWFRSHRFDRVSKLLGEVKMAVTMINAGNSHNVVPDKCTFVVDIRTNEHYTNLEILEIVRQNVSCQVTPRSTNLNSSQIAMNHPVVQRGLQLGLPIFGSPTMSDQVHLACPTLKIGVGDSARSHTADEFVFANEIDEGIKIYTQLLENLKL